MASKPSRTRKRTLHLFVKYNAPKADDHFMDSSLTPTSTAIFRDDLLALKFPHPKTVNMSVNDSEVNAWWPGVSQKMHSALYNNLKNSTNNASKDGLLAQLSISYIKVIEIVGNKETVLASTQLLWPQEYEPPAKRPRLEEAKSLPLPYEAPEPRPVSPEPGPMPPTAQKRRWDGQVVPYWERAVDSGPPRASAHQTVHPLPVRPQSTPPRPPPPPLARMPTPPRAHPPHRHNIPIHQPGQTPPPPPHPRMPTPPRAHPPQRHNLPIHHPGQAQQASQPGPHERTLSTEEQITAAKLAYSRVRSRMLSLIDKKNDILSQLKSLNVPNVPGRMKIVDEDAYAAEKAELEDLRKRVKEMEDTKDCEADNAKRHVGEMQKRLDEEVRQRREANKFMHGAMQKCEEEQREQAKLKLRIQHAEAALAESHEKCTSLQDGLDRSRQRVSCAEGDAAAFQRQLNVAGEEAERTKKKLHETKARLNEERERARSNYERLAISERSEASLRRRLDDAEQQLAALRDGWDRNAQAAAAAQTRNEDEFRALVQEANEERDARLRAEATVRAYRATEDTLRGEVDELKWALDAERELRREAEDAIADVRRECREPFVVPSLLDAFIELAKMTTDATSAPGGGTSQKINAAAQSLSSGSNTLPQRHAPPFQPLTPPPSASLFGDARMGSPPSQIKSEQF